MMNSIEKLPKNLKEWKEWFTSWCEIRAFLYHFNGPFSFRGKFESLLIDEISKDDLFIHLFHPLFIHYSDLSVTWPSSQYWPIADAQGSHQSGNYFLFLTSKWSRHPVTWLSCRFECESIDSLSALPLPLTWAPLPHTTINPLVAPTQALDGLKFITFTDKTSVLPLSKPSIFFPPKCQLRITEDLYIDL